MNGKRISCFQLIQLPVVVQNVWKEHFSFPNVADSQTVIISSMLLSIQ